MKTQREESHVKKKAEITVMLPQAKECLEPPKDEKDKDKINSDYMNIDFINSKIDQFNENKSDYLELDLNQSNLAGR